MKKGLAHLYETAVH